MTINMKVRLRNYRFWVSSISYFILVAQLLGYELPKNWEQLINATLAYFVGQGLLMDPTTAGLNDSARAMSYRVPRKDVIQPMRPLDGDYHEN